MSDFLKKGFTFVELLTVLFIIGLLVAISAGVARYAGFASERASARADLNLLADALDRFYLEFGDYPDGTTASNLLAYAREMPDNDDKYYFARLLPVGFTGKDPWKNYYRYTVVNREAGNDAGDASPFYILKSSGPDKKEDTADDIAYP